MRTVFAMALCAMLSACASATPVVMGHCELPEALAQKSIPLDPVTPGMSLGAQIIQWVKDRGHAARSDKHADDLIDYVGKQCQ
jgi:hypothetical protein